MSSSSESKMFNKISELFQIMNILTEKVDKLTEKVDKLTEINKPVEQSKVTTSTMSKKTYEKPFDSNVYIDVDGKIIVISGNTYNIKSLLRENKCMWSSDKKAWTIKYTKTDYTKIVELVKKEDVSLIIKNASTNTTSTSKKTCSNKKDKAIKKEKPIKKETKPITNSNFCIISNSDSDTD